MDPFALERYFARHEFSAPHLLSPSDTEPQTLGGLLAAADRASLEAWEKLSLGYTESRGLPALRSAIAAFVSESSGAPAHALSPDDVLVFSCAEEAIYATARATVRRGDSIACTWPAYQSLFEVARATGATVRPIPVREVDGRWDLLPGEIDSAIAPGTRMVVANVPHNPTGMVPSPHAWERLKRRAAEVGALLFADEVYRPLAPPGLPLAPSPVIDPDGQAASLGSVSKAFGLAGVRIGWVASRDHDLLDRLERYKDYTTICASAPAEVLAMAALRRWRAVVAGQQAVVDANAREFAAFLARHADLVGAPPPGGGSTAFPAWRGPHDAAEMAERAVAAAGVMVLPGATFDPRGIGNVGIDLSRRFRVGLGRRAFPAALARFADHLSDAYRK